MKTNTPTKILTHAVALFAACLAFSAAVAADRDSEHARKTLEIFETIIEIESSKGLGNVPKIAAYLSDQLLSAGFAEDDVEIIPFGETAAFIARYRGNLSSTKAPILFLAHMDVVEAYESDWERPPFELTQDDTYFYARGTIDNKFGVAQLTSTFIRLQKEGFVPDRDLILVFTGDEETTMGTTKMLAYERPDLAGAEFALNSDGGGGELDDDGRPVTYGIQAAEKTYVTWEITARNQGGHSSTPRIDNAIYDLADAIRRIQEYRFPVRWNDMTLEMMRYSGEQLGGELGEAMLAFAENPGEGKAADRLWREPSVVGQTRTTCVVTMLEAGHAENALPQSATATVNCRIFPGIPASDVQARLQQVIGNDAIEFRQLDEAYESPVSELREDVNAAVATAIAAQYPDVRILGYMSSGGTDGMHFRRAGIPTFGTGGVFMNANDQYAHGLNERVPIKAFYDALDHWTIIIRELAGGDR